MTTPQQPPLQTPAGRATKPARPTKARKLPAPAKKSLAQEALAQQFVAQRWHAPEPLPRKSRARRPKKPDVTPSATPRDLDPVANQTPASGWAVDPFLTPSETFARLPPPSTTSTPKPTTPATSTPDPLREQLALRMSEAAVLRRDLLTATRREREQLEQLDELRSRVERECRLLTTRSQRRARMLSTVLELRQTVTQREGDLAEAKREIVTLKRDLLKEQIARAALEYERDRSSTALACAQQRSDETSAELEALRASQASAELQAASADPATLPSIRPPEPGISGREAATQPDAEVDAKSRKAWAESVLEAAEEATSGERDSIALPDGVGAALPDGVGAALPDGVGAALPDGVGAALPDGARTTPPGTLLREFATPSYSSDSIELPNPDPLPSPPAIFRYWRDSRIRAQLVDLEIEDAQHFITLPIARRCALSSDHLVRVLSLARDDPRLELDLAHRLVEQGVDNFRIECLDLREEVREQRERETSDEGMSPFVVCRERARVFAEPGCFDVVLADGTLREHALRVDSVRALSGNSRRDEDTTSTGDCKESEGSTTSDEMGSLLRAISRVMKPDASFALLEVLEDPTQPLSPAAVEIAGRIWQLMPPRYRGSDSPNDDRETAGEGNPSGESSQQQTDPRELQSLKNAPADGRSCEPLSKTLGEHFHAEAWAAFGHLVEAFIGPSADTRFDAELSADRRFIDQVALLDEARISSGVLEPRYLAAWLSPLEVCAAKQAYPDRRAAHSVGCVSSP